MSIIHPIHKRIPYRLPFQINGIVKTYIGYKLHLIFLWKNEGLATEFLGLIYTDINKVIEKGVTF